MINSIKKAAASLCIIGLASCATVESPDTLNTQARENIERAQSLGADESAPLVMREANQLLSKAERAMENEEYEEARRLLEKSMANSELAIAKTNSRRSQRAAEEIEQNLEALRRQSSQSSESDSYTIQ